MFDRLSRSFRLVGASAQVLRQDKHLMLFPIISGLALFLVLLAFALPLLGLGSIDGIVLLAFLGCVLMHATLTGIYSAVLFRYALYGSDAPGFDGSVLASAFQQKS